MTDVVVQPTLDWYKGISARVGLSPRCPFASVLRCPRFYQSLSLLGDAGSTQIESSKDEWLKQEWQKSDLWPVTAEQATMIDGPSGEMRNFWRFCPEVLFERFGLFASDVSSYGDEIDVEVAHGALSLHREAPEDWRWRWAYVRPCHYTDCPPYSLIRDGKGMPPIPTFPHLDQPDKLTNPWQTFMTLLGPIDTWWKKGLLWILLIGLALFALWVSFPEKAKQSISGFIPKLITHQTPIGNTHSEPEGKKDVTQSPLTVFCTCEAGQTHCFSEEADCQSISQDKGCIRTYSTSMGFNVYGGTEWTKHDDHWINKKCVVK